MPHIEHIAILAEDNEKLASFYISVFGMFEVHRTYRPSGEHSGIYLSDGHINLALLRARGKTEGINHLGFRVEDVDGVYAAAKPHGASVGELPRDGRFAEGYLFDTIGQRIDVAGAGWKTSLAGFEGHSTVTEGIPQ